MIFRSMEANEVDYESNFYQYKTKQGKNQYNL